MFVRSPSRVWSLEAGFLVVLLMVSCFVGCSGCSGNTKSKNTKKKLPTTTLGWIKEAEKHLKRKLTNKAEKAVTEALKLCKDEGDTSDKTKYYARIANIQIGLNNEPEAKKSLILASEAAKEIKNAEDQAVKLTEIAVVIGKIDPKDARPILKQAEGIVEKIKDTGGKILVYKKIAEAYGELKFTTSADRVLKLAIALAKAAKKPIDQCKMLADIAVSQYKINKDSTGFDAALSIAQKIEKDYTKAFGLLSVTNKMIDVGLKGKARKILKEAAVIEIEDESQKSEVVRELDRLLAKIDKK